MQQGKTEVKQENRCDKNQTLTSQNVQVLREMASALWWYSFINYSFQGFSPHYFNWTLRSYKTNPKNAETALDAGMAAAAAEAAEAPCCQAREKSGCWDCVVSWWAESWGLQEQSSLTGLQNLKTKKDIICKAHKQGQKVTTVRCFLSLQLLRFSE